MYSPSRALLAFLLLSISLIAACSDDAVVPESDDSGTITTWAGNGVQGYDGDNHKLLESSFYWPIDVEITPTIGTYIVDWNNHRVRRVTAEGRLETVVGTADTGDGPVDQSDQVYPGAPGTACLLNHPTDVFERNDGVLQIVAWHNHKLREWNPATGNVYITIGRGPGCAGDGGLASAARLDQACRATQAADGSIYIVDQRNQVIRKIDPAGIITCVVGAIVCPTPTPLNPGGFEGDGLAPAVAKMKQPTGSNPSPGGGIAIDDQGRVYFADTNNQRIRRVDFVANVIVTVVGNGTAAYAGDDGDPLNASLNVPTDIEFGPDGRLYIADSGNHVIRVVDFASNRIETIAGTGTAGFSGDGGPAASARLDMPLGIGFDADGNLYIADTNNNRIRRVKMQ